jgi:uracil-DNA glycosylase family 4
VALEARVDCPDLPSLAEHIGDCHRCPLGDTRTKLVFGVGDPHAELMFIGEAPGKNEDLQGEPFVGAAGKFLDELLASIGLTRSQVYIANVLKCRPPNNRDPIAIEIATCTPFLAQQVRLIDPTVIATLGNFATRWLLDTTAGITTLRGKLYHVEGMQVVPIFHPAVALYDPRKRDALFDDFKRLRAVMDRTAERPGIVTAQEECAPEDLWGGQNSGRDDVAVPAGDDTGTRMGGASDDESCATASTADDGGAVTPPMF